MFPDQSDAGSPATRYGGAVARSARSPNRRVYSLPQTKWSCHAVCSRASWSRPGLSSMAVPAGAVQCLDLAFFVAAQHQRMLWRRNVQPDNILQLFGKPGIAGNLERLDQMGLESIGLPYLVYCG